MKFKDLPEGYYLVLRVTSDTAYLELKDVPPEKEAIYSIDPYMKKVVKGKTEYRHFGRILDDLEAVFKPRDQVRKEERLERKSYGAKLGHVKKHLYEKKPMTGKVLETALELVTCEDPSAGINRDPFYTGMAEKMKSGQPLTDYEVHILVDVLMLHSRLSI
jgi:hypothetical protein